jgi:hypothetical protein
MISGAKTLIPCYGVPRGVLIFSSPEDPNNNQQHLSETPRFVLYSILLIDNGIFLSKICSYISVNNSSYVSQNYSMLG